MAKSEQDQAHELTSGLTRKLADQLYNPNYDLIEVYPGHLSDFLSLNSNYISFAQQDQSLVLSLSPLNDRSYHTPVSEEACFFARATKSDFTPYTIQQEVAQIISQRQISQVKEVHGTILPANAESTNEIKTLMANIINQVNN